MGTLAPSHQTKTFVIAGIVAVAVFLAALYVWAALTTGGPDLPPVAHPHGGTL